MTMKHSSTPWWTTDEFAIDQALPPVGVGDDLLGPNGLALVKTWPDGTTDKGWGLNPPKGSSEGFMPRYLRNEFNSRRVLFGYDRKKWAFAFIMRSWKLVAVDIDGKNGGVEGAKKLVLPPTLAETSKSGNGFHLFYLHEEVWDLNTGFGDLGDRIGFEQGVDFRATGCVYHHDTQRWNGRAPAPLPDHLVQILKSREQKLAARSAGIVAALESDDPLEALLMHDEILTRLKKPIKPGKRNNTLFAIGAEMATAQIPDWETLLADRADQVGLPDEETEKLIKNIQHYALSGVSP
jgi:Bifunctional DNA primase/polymerase, N-terminal